jgi:hypothetical protein
MVGSGWPEPKSVLGGTSGGGAAEAVILHRHRGVGRRLALSRRRAGQGRGHRLVGALAPDLGAQPSYGIMARLFDLAGPGAEAEAGDYDRAVQGLVSHPRTPRHR